MFYVEVIRLQPSVTPPGSIGFVCTLQASLSKKKKSITTSSREKPGFAPERPKRPNFGRRGVGTADDRSVMSSIFIRVLYVGLLGPDRCPTIAGGVVGPLREKGPQKRVPSTSSLSVSVHCCNHWTNTAVSERG